MAKKFLVICTDDYKEDWPPAQRLLYFELCRKAAYKEIEVNGVTLHKGQLLTSVGELSHLLGIGKSSASYAIKALVGYGVITCEIIHMSTGRKGSPLATKVTINYGISALQKEYEATSKTKHQTKNRTKEEQKLNEITNELHKDNKLTFNNLKIEKETKQTKNRTKEEQKLNEITNELQNEKPQQLPINQEITQPYNIYNNIINKEVEDAHKKNASINTEFNKSTFRFDEIIPIEKFKPILETAIELNPNYDFLIYKTGVNPSTAPGYIPEFVAQCDVNKTVHRTEKDILNHFLNYLRIKAEVANRKSVQDKINNAKIQRYGNYQQQEQERFQRTQRELIGDMLFGDDRVTRSRFEHNDPYSKPEGIACDSEDVYGLPSI